MKTTAAENTMSLLSALLLLGAASIWLVMPAQAVGLFGIPLEGRSFPAYGTLKGIEDLVPALMIVLFVIQKNRQALFTALLVSLLVPVVDMWLVFGANGLTAGLLMHIPYVIFPLVGAYLLRDAARGPGELTMPA